MAGLIVKSSYYKCGGNATLSGYLRYIATRPRAERLGYDNAENWRALVNASLCDIAKGYKIHPDHLRWYAAFHEKEKSVHIHMVVFSSDPKEGYLTPDGIRQVKSAFTRRIFQQELMHVYEQKTAYRNQLQQNAAETMQELIWQEAADFPIRQM